MRDLRKDLETCNQATPGPWEWQENKWWGGHSGMTGKGGVSVLYPNHSNDGDDGAAWFDDWENDNDRIFIAAAREGWPEAIERAIKAEAEVERLRMALDKIANPLKYIQMEARAKGAELNGVYATMLSKDPSYLQEIALAELDKEES